MTIPVDLPEGRRLLLTPTEEALNAFARAAKALVFASERYLCSERGGWVHSTPRLREEMGERLDEVGMRTDELRRVLGIQKADL